MPLITESEARALLEKVVKLSKADECTAGLTSNVDGNIRFARNSVSTSGIVHDASIGITVAYGKRSGSTSTNAFDDASLERAVRRAEELAKLAPENPEFMPAIPKQTYKPTATFDAATAAITTDDRARAAADSIDPCRAGKLVAAGFLADAQQATAIANSNGNFGYQTSTTLDYTCTVRTDDGRGSGWVARNVGDVKRFDAKSEIRVAMEKARGSVDAKALEPGKYTVILEPAASAGLIAFMMQVGFDARQADEGRNFLARKGGGNRLGEKVFGDQVNMIADPADPACAVLPWDEDGLPRERTPIITNGRVDYLQYSRYWAKKQGKAPSAGIGNFLIAGGDKSTAELVKGTKKGVLVTRMWYIRMVDPQTVLLTGLTRDGTFYIENGVVKYPIKNFRFNESPVIMLNNVEEFGKPERVADDESPYLMMIPPMKIRDFTFTSLSDAV